MKKITLLVLVLVVMVISVTTAQNISSTKHNNLKQEKMEHKDFTSTILVNKSTAQTFDAIKDFRGWWSEDIDGETEKLGETFLYHYQDVHFCKIRLIEEVPGKLLVYKVIDNEFSFIKDKTEWINTKLIFELSAEGEQTRVKFTHHGLVPEYECYNVCNDAWTGFIQKSLKDFINTGKGQPNPKDGTNQINAENLKKWKIDADKTGSYAFSFETKHGSAEVYAILSDPNKWWKGIYDEHITGNFGSVGDEFTYKAGGGMHYSLQKVQELVPDKRIVWLVTKSELSFLHDKEEWTGTRIVMTISGNGDRTKVEFRHEGLLPAIECYGACSSAWSLYMGNLKKALE